MTPSVLLNAGSPNGFSELIPLSKKSEDYRPSSSDRHVSHCPHLTRNFVLCRVGSLDGRELSGARRRSQSGAGRQRLGQQIRVDDKRTARRYRDAGIVTHRSERRSSGHNFLSLSLHLDEQILTMLPAQVRRGLRFGICRAHTLSSGRELDRYSGRLIICHHQHRRHNLVE